MWDAQYAYAPEAGPKNGESLVLSLDRRDAFPEQTGPRGADQISDNKASYPQNEPQNHQEVKHAIRPDPMFCARNRRIGIRAGSRGCQARETECGCVR